MGEGSEESEGGENECRSKGGGGGGEGVVECGRARHHAGMQMHNCSVHEFIGCTSGNEVATESFGRQGCQKGLCVCLIVCLTHCVHVPVSFPDCCGMGMGLVSIAVILYM